jgi:hypothetical protein
MSSARDHPRRQLWLRSGLLGIMHYAVRDARGEGTTNCLTTVLLELQRILSGLEQPLGEDGPRIDTDSSAMYSIVSSHYPLAWVTPVASPMHQKRAGQSANRTFGYTAGPANPTAQGPPRYVRRLSLGSAASTYSAFWFALHSLYFRLGVLLA